MNYVLTSLYRKNKIIKGGIQVKPKTFNKMRKRVYMQKKQNKKWGYPVWYLFYNKNESFFNKDAVVEKLKVFLDLTLFY